MIVPQNTNIWDSAVTFSWNDGSAGLADHLDNMKIQAWGKESWLSNAQCYDLEWTRRSTGRPMERAEGEWGCGDVDRLAAKFNRSVEMLWSPENGVTSPNEDDDDGDCLQELPLDFQELLSSPTNHPTPSAELFSLVNKPDDKVRATFLQCGTNITSSIWSQQSGSDSSLYEPADNSIKGADVNANNYWRYNALDETNEYFYRLNNNLTNDIINAFPWECNDFSVSNKNKWSDIDACDFKTSLLKLNHDKNSSCFAEVVPKVPKSDTFPSTTNLPEEITECPADDKATGEEDDLLTSARTHFCPIRSENGENYLPDGVSFQVDGSPDFVKFHRSESGYLFLFSEDGVTEKYMEYKTKCEPIEYDVDEVSCRRSAENEREFVLKFVVRQNEKCCQTDPEDAVVSSVQEIVPAKRRVVSVSSNDDNNDIEILQECGCFLSDWETQLWENSSEDWWPTNTTTWCSHAVPCSATNAPAASPCLREEVRREGEQLLSDLSSLLCDASELCSVDEPVENSGNLGVVSDATFQRREERKRRHSACLVIGAPGVDGFIPRAATF